MCLDTAPGGGRIDNACGDTGHPLAVKQKLVDFRGLLSILVVELIRFVSIWVDLSRFKLIWVDFVWSILIDFVIIVDSR